ncbi:unnamed protein product, partial [Adineta ricciae]
LYGGLVIILRLIAPLLIDFVLNFKSRSRNINMYPLTRLSKFIQWMKRLNLFKTINDRTENSIKQQRIITRVYLVLLTSSIIILTLYNSLNTQIMTITVSNPSFDTYNDLQNFYSTTLKCPCTTMTIPYNNSMSLSPTLHQICSSDFVSNRWIEILRNSLNVFEESDWRNQAYTQFQLLSNLCELANQTIKDTVDGFLLQSFVTSNMLNETNFHIQLNVTINQVFQSMLSYFDLLLNTVDLIIQVDQPYMGVVAGRGAYLSTNIYGHIYQGTLQFIFFSHTMQNINSSLDIRICATNRNCQNSIATYEMIIPDYNEYDQYIFRYTVPGSIMGCSNIQSLFLSTLECFYSNSDCLSILKNYLYERYIQNVEDSLWFDIQPLNYNLTLNVSRYPPNTSISMIIKELMIGQRNPLMSYKNFYDSCAPSDCTYLKRIHDKTFLEIMIMLISMIGGLTVSLRLITPYVCTTILHIVTKRNTKQTPQVQLKWCDRIRLFVPKLIILWKGTLLNLNIFPQRYFSSNVSQMTAKRLGQWATRLYIIFLILFFAVFSLAIIVQPELSTKIFHQPSFDLYNDLKQQYGDQLECSCSTISSLYREFITIEPIFHEVCSSSFVSDQWRIDLTQNIDFNFSNYDQQDYRRFLSAHLQFLRQLCQLSNQSINSSVEQFLSSLFITDQLLSEENFNTRLFSLIEQVKSNAPTGEKT